MKIHTLAGYIQHIYLVEDSEGILLLDGCSRADVDKVCQYITQTLGRPVSRPKAYCCYSHAPRSRRWRH